jgi:hypothetical protein
VYPLHFKGSREKEAHRFPSSLHPISQPLYISTNHILKLTPDGDFDIISWIYIKVSCFHDRSLIFFWHCEKPPSIMRRGRRELALNGTLPPPRSEPATGLMSGYLKKDEVEGCNPPPYNQAVNNAHCVCSDDSNRPPFVG